MKGLQSLKHWELLPEWHGATSQKMWIFVISFVYDCSALQHSLLYIMHPTFNLHCHAQHSHNSSKLPCPAQPQFIQIAMPSTATIHPNCHAWHSHSSSKLPCLAQPKFIQITVPGTATIHPNCHALHSHNSSKLTCLAQPQFIQIAMPGTATIHPNCHA